MNPQLTKMGRTDLNGDGEYAFLYRELLFNIEHVEKVNEGELGHSRILIGTRGPKYGQHPTAAPATAHAFRTRDACLGMAQTLRAASLVTSACSGGRNSPFSQPIASSFQRIRTVVIAIGDNGTCADLCRREAALGSRRSRIRGKSVVWTVP